MSALCCLFACKAPEQKVMARFVPERADDFVFENNLVAGRFYGEALEGNPTSPGVDIWVKLPGALVANDWYAHAVEDGGYYHHDHGGKDCYKVAVSLGGGASVPLIADTLRQLPLVRDPHRGAGEGGVRPALSRMGGGRRHPRRAG